MVGKDDFPELEWTYFNVFKLREPGLVLLVLKRASGNEIYESQYKIFNMHSHKM
jgi:hypothetical protein